jgi:hypothetical protein
MSYRVLVVNDLELALNDLASNKAIDLDIV